MMMDPIKVSFKFTRLITIFVSATILNMVSLTFILIGFASEGRALILLQLIGVLALLYFVPLIFYLFIAVITRKPAFIISEEGITDKSQLYGSGFIKWDDIEKVTIGSKYSTTFLSIDTYDPDLLLNKTKGVKRLYLLLTEMLTVVQTQVDVSRLAITEDELIQHFTVYSKGKFNAENITETNIDEWKI